MTDLKKHVGGRRWSLRRLMSMLHDYPRATFIAVVRDAYKYRLFEMNHLEDMILRQIAADFHKPEYDSE